MAILVGPGCSIRQHPDLVADGQDDAGLIWDVFFMEFHVRDAVLNHWLEDDSPIRLHDVNTNGPLRKRWFVVRRDRLSRSQSLAFEHVSFLLSLLRIPPTLHASFVQVIRSGALSLANETTNIGRHIIPVVVEIDLWFMGEEVEEEEEEDEDEIFPAVVDIDLSFMDEEEGEEEEGEGEGEEEEEEGDEDEDEDEDEIMAEVMSSSLNDVMDLVVPATGASIEALEKIKFEDVNSTDKCMICLEEFSTESVVSRMPCSHIYHGDCIIQWLKRSHMCPLCRFKMPAISS